MKWLCVAKLFFGVLVFSGCASTQSDNGTTTTTQVAVPEMFQKKPAFHSGADPDKRDFEELKDPPDFTGFDVVAIVPPSEPAEEKPAETEAED